MQNYYVNQNAQPTGEHEVHKHGCAHLPDEANRKYLGLFNNCKEAVEEAKKHYDNVDGCFHCCFNSHKR